jgi:hypothetical protein
LVGDPGQPIRRSGVLLLKKVLVAGSPWIQWQIGVPKIITTSVHAAAWSRVCATTGAMGVTITVRVRINVTRAGAGSVRCFRCYTCLVRNSCK